MSIFAIGDIHGMATELDTLLRFLPRTESDTTVFLGDYIDRGPDSPGVVRRVLAEYDAAPNRTILLWGNHEDMAAGAYGLPSADGIATQTAASSWLANGGDKTLRQFGPELEHDMFPAPEFVLLCSLLRVFWRDPANGVYFVHGGIPVGIVPEDTCVHGGDGFNPNHIGVLVWYRPTINSSSIGRTIICGHTPQVNGVPRKIGDHIIIDTACVYGGPLTALQLPEMVVWQAKGDQVRRLQIESTADLIPQRLATVEDKEL